MGLSLLALAFLVGAAFAGPLQKQEASQCSAQCPNSSHQKFDYEVGKAYTYEYRGENWISAAGKPKQKATIEGLAVIHVKGRCEMVLQLKNLRVQQKLSQEEIQELVQRLEAPVPFAYQDGKVEHVCPSQEEDLQSLNIKKGLISTLINTMSKLDTPQEVKEFDSLGNCATKYTVKYAQGLEVQKEKNLKSCTHRHSSVTALITNPYENPDSKIHTLPLFPEEKLVCKQQVEDKIIKRVECKEQAKIQPLKQRDSVIQFEGQVQLTLLSITAAEHLQISSKTSQESILYNLEEHQDASSRERETEQLLRQMCAKNQQALDVTVSKDFIQLVSQVKRLPYSSLSRMHSSLKNGRICSSKKVRDMFEDTLPMAGSDAAIKLMVQLFERNEISGLKAKFWPATLALIPNPTRQTVAEIVPLLKEQPSAVVLLGVSAMVHRFCSAENCDNEQAVQQIVSSLDQQLGQGCSSENESQALSALKAFGNMGYHGQAERNILECARNKDKPTRLRLAAIDAFRRINQKRPEELLSIYTDSQEDYELRIAAFASVMRQADAQQLRTIKRTAEQENDDQVSGYTSSFIKNMRKTSSPLKKHVKHFLQQIEINPPKVNYWKNSKNIELSTFSESFNVGGSIETDIIHSQDTKIPRAITASFNTDILNHNVNLFEIGIRAEGLEAIVKNLIGLKDKIPKTPSWNFLSSDNILGNTDASASAYIRTMNTEIFDLSASDLSGVGEMIKIADLMNKLAQGKSSDFSHSFLFMNSQLVIPSVTGRSYSFGLTGSASVGLTASTKMDLLKFPRSTDVSAHFQPSVNVEVSTTVGIQSNKQRPDIKLTSRMHLESDMQAEFKIKDGHLAIASVSLPSENVVMARVSSDVVEIDAHHQEKPVYERMQKKVDYCFNKLQKPLGIAICGVLEVPKPFVSKSFPYVHGVGSMEFSIKKTDSSMKSYELSLERPKHSGPIRKFKAAFDTPGSQVSRQFSAEIEVKQQGKGHQEYSVELKSPFKNAGGKGSYTYRQDLIQGAFELHSGSSQWFSANASTHIASSRTKQIMKPSLQITVGSHQPMQVGGTISITKGRKQLITIDIKTNKPSRKPIALKGTILKEGKLDLSNKSEWKVSSDLSFESVFFDAQTRSIVEKQSKQAQTISASIETDYKRGSQKHSVKLAGTSQHSSSKLSTNAQFQSTQYPSSNWALKWEMQGKPRQSLKNDINLKYGPNPERTYISIKQSSHIPSSGPGQCQLSVQAPQFQVDSELTVKHEVEWGHTPKIQFEADLRYKADKHIKGLLHFDHASIRPLKASTRAELEFPGRKLSYSDEVEETSQNKFEGMSRLQWKQDKQVKLQYTYQVLSDESKFHHEIETSLQVPSRQRPIQSKASLKLQEDSLSLEGNLSLRQQTQYSVNAHLNKRGSSQVQLQTPKLEGSMKVSNEQQRKSFDLDMRVKGRTDRRIKASASAQLPRGIEQSFEAEMSWDADRRPEQKLSISSKLEKSSSRYSSSNKLQITDLIYLAITQVGQRTIIGSHEGSIDISSRHFQPIRLQHSHKISSEQVKSQMKFSRNQEEKIELAMEGAIRKDGQDRETYAKASLKSLDNSFQNKEFEVRHQQQKSGASTDMKTSFRLQRSPSKTYKAEMNSKSHPSGIQMSAQVHTPHKMFSKQSVDMSVQKSEDSISSSLSIELPENKVISISSELQKKNQQMSSTLALTTPFDIVKTVKAHLSIDSHRSKKTILSYLDVNNARLGDVEASMSKLANEMELQGRLKVSPIPNVQFQGLSLLYKQSRSSLDFDGEIQLQGDKKISASARLTKERSGKSASATLSTPFQSVKSISTSYKQSRSSVELSASAQYQKDQEISINSQISKERSSLSATVALVTPYNAIKEAKAHLSIEDQKSQKSLLAYVDANGERKSDVEISYSSDSNGMEVQGRVKTARTQELSAHAKVEKSGKSFSMSANVVQGAARLLSIRQNKKQSQRQQSQRQETESLEKTLLDVQVSRESSRDGDNYSVKVAGQMVPLSIQMSTSRSESNALSIEASACQEAQQNQCYRLKTLHKALSNSEGYRHYQGISVDFEKSSGDSEAEQLGSASVIFAASEHDYKSKITVQYEGQNVGYEVRVHTREHQHDHCTVDAHIFTPEQTSRARASLKHLSDELSLEVEVIPDSAQPQRKLGFELKRESPKQKGEISGYLQLSTPNMQKPILLTLRMQKEGKYPVRGKLELSYSSVPGSRAQSKTVTLEIDSELQQSSSGKKSISYKLYSGDKSLDVSLELKKQVSRQQDTYGYEWSYRTHSSQKKGGVSIKLSHKKHGRPQNIDISYYTPSVDLEIQGRSAQAPTEMSVSLLSKGKMVKEIKIRTTENCLEMDVQRSGPLFQSSLCVNKHVGDAVQFVSLEASYRRQKSLDMSVGIEPENPAFIDVRMQWKMEDLCQALSEITGLSDLLHDRSLQELEQELREKWDELKRDVIAPAYRDLVRRFKQMKQQRTQQLQKAMKRHHQMLKDQMQKVESYRQEVSDWAKSVIPMEYIQHEVIAPLVQATKCLFDTYLQLALKHLPDLARIVIDVTKEQFEHCLKKFCVSGTFCHDLKRTYERHGYKQAKKLIQQKMQQSKQSLQQKISKVNPVPELVRKVRETVQYFKREVNAIFGKFFGTQIISRVADFGRKLEKTLRIQFIAYLDKIIEKVNDIFQMAEKDEDFRTVKALVQDAQKKVKYAWKNKQSIAKQEWQPMKSSIMQKSRELLHDRLEVTEFDPKHGSIMIRVRHPLGPRHIQVVKNALTAAKQRLEQSVSH